VTAPSPVQPSEQLRILRQGRQDYRWQQAQLYGAEPIHGRVNSDGRAPCGADANEVLAGVVPEFVTCPECRRKR
jgi:hypothetical protein